MPILRFYPLIFILLLPVARADSDPLSVPLNLDQTTRQQRIDAARPSAPVSALSTSSLASASRGQIGPHIRRLLDENKRLNQTLSNPAPGSNTTKPSASSLKGNPFVRLQDDRKVQVYVRLDQTSPEQLDRLSRSGLDIELFNESLRLVQGWISLDQLEQLNTLAGIQSISAPRYAQSNRGSVTTQGDSILLANQLRAQGHTGKGIRIGIISDGANDWTASRARGDLPASGITRYGSCSKRSANPSQCISKITCNEGTAMAEIIYDLAPDAKIAVSSASTSLDFIQRVNQLVNTFKADIIVDDLSYFGEPYFEDGDIAKAVAALSDQVLFVSAAGNSGSGHYEQNYRAAPGGNFHDFGRASGSSSDSDMGIIIPARGYLLMLMQWNEPFSAPASDYDLALFDAQGQIVNGSFENQADPGAQPFEGFCAYNPNYYDLVQWLAVDKYSGANKRLEMFNLSSSAQEYEIASGSVFGHAGVPSVLAVGTINADDSGHNTIAYYSSRGPARIDFPSIQNRNKPDLIGIDGVRVTGTGGFSTPFYGTSAAAPHIAAIAAQLMSVSPFVKANDVRQALIDGAVDLGSSGFDSSYGYGRVNALGSFQLMKYSIVVTPAIMLLLD